jgi:hypothetical protein
MSQTLINQPLYARSMNNLITLSDGTLEISDGNINNANNINTNYLKTQLLDISSNVVIDGNLNLKGNFTAGDISSDLHTINGKMTFNNVVPECSILPTTSQQLTNKSYTDTNFVYKTGAVNESINGLKTFTDRVVCTAPSIGTSVSDLINVTYADTWYGRLNNTNNWSGLNNFQVNKVTIAVQNSLWTDGSGNTPTNAAKVTTMFSNVKNTTIIVQGWTFSGTAISTINGYGADWIYGDPGGFNNFGGPSPDNGPYWMSFYCYSPGTTQTNSTFYLEAPPTLQPGMYVISWESKFNAGTQYSTTSLTVSLGGTTTLLSYNDSDTRSTNVYRSRSITFEVKTASKLRWTYGDTQATSNRFFAATIGGLTITQYPALKVFDASNNSYIAGSLSQLTNVLMKGTNNITGTLSMSGIPTFYSSRGSNNLCISTDFTQASLTNSTNICLGSIGYYGATYNNNILIGMNSMNDGSYPGRATCNNSIQIGNDGGYAYQDDIMIGNNIQKKGTSGLENVLIGNYICQNATSSQPLLRCVAIGNNIWRAYYFQAGANQPTDNVAVGSYAQGQSNDFIGGSYNTSVGSYSMTYISGVLANASYNTTIGYYSGVDPLAILNTAYREKYYGGTYIGAWARSRGNVAGINYATALGYNASADASYCTVIGADASYNVANSIRLGRPQDKTVVSSLWSQGQTDISGNLNVDGDVNITTGKLKNRNVNLNYADNSHITGATTLTFPVNEYYSVQVLASADYDITLPEITSASQLGTKITFIAVNNTTYSVNVKRTGTSNVIVSGTTTYTTAVTALYPPTTHRCDCIALKSGTNYGWYIYKFI